MWRLVAVVGLAGCGRVAFDARAGDAGGFDAVDAACAAWSPWSAPARLPGPINDPTNDDWEPTPTQDELAIYFYSYRAGSQGSDLWFGTRAAKTDPFSAPTRVVAVDTAGSEGTPSLTEDGLVLLYTNAAADIAITQRATTADAWDPPTTLAVINTVDPEDDAFLSADGLRLMFVSARVGMGRDIYETSRPDRSADFAPPTLLVPLQSATDDYSPTFSADALDVWFSSSRTGGPGMDDIYTAHRTAIAQPFSTPVVVPELSSARDDNGVRLVPDGTTMYLNYDTLTSGGANADLYIATRTCL